MKSLEEIKNLNSYKKFIDNWNTSDEYEWLHLYDNDLSYDETLNKYVPFFENNRNIKELTVFLNNIRFGIKKVYKRESKRKTKKGIVDKTDYFYSNIDDNTYDMICEQETAFWDKLKKRSKQIKPTFLDSIQISVQPRNTAKIIFLYEYNSDKQKYIKKYKLIKDYEKTHPIYKIIISNTGIYYKSGSLKAIPLTMKCFSKFVNFICNSKLKKDVIDFVFDVIGEDTYLIKDIKRNLYSNMVFLQNISFDDLCKYHNIKEYYLSKYKNLPNIDFNKYDYNLSYIIIKIYHLLNEKQLQQFIIDFKNNYYKFTNKDLLSFKYNRIYELLSNVLYKIYYYNISDDYDPDLMINENQRYINDYINLCKLKKSKINLYVKNAKKLKELHDEAVEQLANKKKKKMNKKFNFTKSKFKDLIERMPNEYKLINNELMLYNEGNIQHNCVYTYLNSIINDVCIIYTCEKNNQHYTIEICQDNNNLYYLNQMKAKFNAYPIKEDYNKLLNDINEINQNILN